MSGQAKSYVIDTASQRFAGRRCRARASDPPGQRSQGAHVDDEEHREGERWAPAGMDEQVPPTQRSTSFGPVVAGNAQEPDGVDGEEHVQRNSDGGCRGLGLTEQ